MGAQTSSPGENEVTNARRYTLDSARDLNRREADSTDKWSIGTLVARESAHFPVSGLSRRNSETKFRKPRASGAAHRLATKDPFYLQSGFRNPEALSQ